METKRTVRIRLTLNSEQSDLLTRSVNAYTLSFNAVSSFGWKHKETNGVALHHATYYEHRKLYGLPAELTVSARVKATEALKSAKNRSSKGQKISCPNSTLCSIRYSKNAFSIWFDRLEVSLLTLEGRVKLPIKIPDFYLGYTTWKPCSADLIKDKKNRWWLHITVSKDILLSEPTEETLGVDLGIVKPATDSNGTHYGSEHWKVVEDRIFEHHHRLQSKGTKSARRRLRKVSGRQKRFRRDCDHILSKRLVRSVDPGSTLVFEKLTDIRSRAKQRKAQRRRFHGWSFAQLQAFTEYKAEARSVRVAYIDPRYTSQMCSECQHVEKGNRPSQVLFSCRKCGYTANADFNAARNIRDKYLRAAVNRPIVAGPLVLAASSALLG